MQLRTCSASTFSLPPLIVISCYTNCTISQVGKKGSECKNGNISPYLPVFQIKAVEMVFKHQALFRKFVFALDRLISAELKSADGCHHQNCYHQHHSMSQANSSKKKERERERANERKKKGHVNCPCSQIRTLALFISIGVSNVRHRKFIKGFF